VPHPAFPAEISRELRMDLVTRLLDDMNVLGEALVAALNERDYVRTATLRASLARYALDHRICPVLRGDVRHIHPSAG